MRILAFDFGLGHIGVAVGNSEFGTCQELKALRARDGIPEEIALKAVFSEWAPQRIVVGLPLNMDGTEQEMTRRARKFGNRTAAKFRLPVVFIDERLTSAEAKSEIFREGGFRALVRDKGHIDSISAVKILEQYFVENPA
ncbi:MAG: Holliday junction resolvase RuvX [Succinivibrio sp.]|nr:Holliday junction resolvase RuvX [Succinivibrio sp.]